MLPLTVLQGHLITLQDRVKNARDIDTRTVAQALQEAHYIASILHNLSAVAKLEGGDLQVRMDPVDLNALVERAVSRHTPIAQSNRIEIDFAVPEQKLLARGDVTLIEQAVSNVVHNAVRYNKPGGHVAVLLEERRDDTTDPADRFSLRVIDDGPGIPDEELARLPERRFRGNEARTRHPEGLGLGLSITRDVAGRHGFELQLRRSEYGGLEVELTGALYAEQPTSPIAAELPVSTGS
jgi:signal transduction histidine kinase